MGSIHTDECLAYAAKTRKAFCIDSCGQARRRREQAELDAAVRGTLEATPWINRSRDGKPFCFRHRVTWDEQQASQGDECKDCGRDRDAHRYQYACQFCGVGTEYLFACDTCAKNGPGDEAMRAVLERWSAASSQDLRAALAPLVAIADAYDANELDDEARKRWGVNLEHESTTPPESIELYTGRGGRRLLTLQHCLDVRALVRGAHRPLAPMTDDPLDDAPRAARGR